VRRARRARAFGLLVVATLSLVSCSSGDELDGTSWQAVELGPRPTVPDVVSTIAFEDGEVSGSGGCNTYSGTYEARASGGAYGPDENTISINDVGGTEIACEDLVMAQEAAFYDALTNATTYSLVVDRLELLDGDEILVAFVRVED
jgi:heat shock protein HslJ